MNNFKPGGQRNRKEFLGGRPKSDANYGPKKRFESNDRGPRRDDRGGERKIELFTTACTTCGKSCEVPFKPDGTKPVLCRDCFAAKNAGGDNARSGNRFPSNDLAQRKPERSFDAPRVERAPGISKEDFAALSRHVTALDAKINEILELVKSAHVVVEKSSVAAEVATGEEVTIKKVRKPKKVTKVVKKVVKKAAKKVTKKK
jgi:CxxC-x17-CxxC domain-containing protein